MVWNEIVERSTLGTIVEAEAGVKGVMCRRVLSVLIDVVLSLDFFDFLAGGVSASIGVGRFFRSETNGSVVGFGIVVVIR